MANLIIRRLFQGLIVLILLSFLVFILMRLMPGDPVLIYMSRSQAGQASIEQLQALRHEYGLDKPILIQYFNWAGNALRGNLGVSIIKHTTVLSLINRALPITLYLGILAFIVSIILGIPAGIFAAIKRARLLDYVITPLSILGVCVPIFWLAVMMAYVFGLKLHWLPIFGFTSPFEDLTLSLKQMIMPVFCESLGAIAGCSRQTRSAMLEVIRQDYIRTAWAKGLTARVVVTRHALKNAIIPVVTLAGLQLGTIIGGAVLVETIFNIPGMGRLLVNSIFNQDYAVVQGVAIIFCGVLVVVNILVDISYGWFDPRVRFA